MAKLIPVWILLLLCLIWALITVGFGWAVKSTVSGSERSGVVGKVAVKIASFPTVSNEVIRQVIGYASGDYKDEAIRVLRDIDRDYSEFHPAKTQIDIDIPGLLIKADLAKLSPGWRVLSGAFDVNGEIQNAALLISKELEIVKIWIFDEIPVDGKDPRPRHRKFVHGIEVLKDGSLIFTFDGSISLQRIDSCGNREWVTPGAFHHAVTLDESGQSVWTFADGETIAQVFVTDGMIARRITLDEIIKRNPEIDILELRREHANELGMNSRNSIGKWLSDPFHLNDVDPLSEKLAAKFPMFEKGDLLISARSLNLIFVLDPQTIRIKWWRMGATQRQHDPDWGLSGNIVVFNNRMSRDYSEIIAINPVTFDTTTLLDGRDHGFYTRIRGKQQLLDDETLVVSSPQQGSAFEVTREGNIVFEAVNFKPNDDSLNYVLSELRWLPIDYFDKEFWKCEK